MFNINVSALKSGSNSVSLTEKQEQLIIDSGLINKPLQLSDLKEIIDLDSDSAKNVRSSYRKEIKKVLTEETKFNTIDELAKGMSEIKTFGNLKHLKVFGFQVKGSKRNDSYLYFVKNESEKKDSKKK
jgi:hypothetical protein